MKCKGCGEEIDSVRVYSECWQYGTLDGNKITDYGLIQDFSDDWSSIECPECHADLTEEVEA